MASFYPLRRDGPVTLEAVASSLRAGAAKAEAVARKLAAPKTPAQQMHKALVAKENSCEDVLRIASVESAELDANNVATAIHKVAQSCRREGGPRAAAALRGDTRFHELVASGVHCADTWTPRQLCHVAWSIAVLQADRQGGAALLTRVTAAFAARGASEGVPQDLSTVAWALAVLAFSDKNVLSRIAEASSARIAEFVPQDLAIAGWAFAKLLYEGRRPLLERIAEESHARISTFSGRNLANVAWTFATSVQRDLRLFEALAGACVERMSELGPQELPIALWSFAAISYPASDVFQAAAGQVMRSFDGMDVSHVCNVAWAFARGGARQEPLFELLAEQASRRLDAMETMHLANLAWAFANVSRADEFEEARLGIRHEALFTGIAAAAAQQPQGLLPQHSASLVWAMASCTVTGTATQALADCVEASIRCNPSHEYTPRHAAGILWALAVQAQTHEPLCTALLDRATLGGIDELARDGPAHLASIAWASARLPCSKHTGLRLALRSNVDGLLAALAGSAVEISEGRQQNIASVVRSLYDMGLADTARALFVRAMDMGVCIGAEAWAAWLCGAACAGHVELESHVWRALAATYEAGPQRAIALNAAAVRALAADRPQLAVAALRDFGSEATALSNHLQKQLGLPSQRAVPSQTSPRGGHRLELGVAGRLLESARHGDALALLEAAETMEAGDILGFAAGARCAALDAALDLAQSGRADGSPLLVVELGCGVGAAAVRAACRLRGRAAAHVAAFDCEALCAAAGLNVVEWADLSGSIGLSVGRGEQVLPELLRSRGSGCVDVLVLNSQGVEYNEELARAEDLGLLAPGAVILADSVLQPLAPELMWRVCSGGLVDFAGVVPIEDNWVLIARLPSHMGARGKDWCQRGLPPPAAVAQLRHQADEAQRRTVAWRRRDRLVAFPGPSRPDEAEAARQAYAAVGITPPLYWPAKLRGRWCVDLTAAALPAAEAG